MFYASNEDLPIHCLMNLPEDAQQVYRNAFNRAWASTPVFRSAQMRAWTEVRKKFEKDPLSGRWVPRLERRQPAARRGRQRLTANG